MTPSRPRHRPYTYAEYVALEATSSTKHEYLDGEIYAMAGGLEDHSALSVEVLFALRSAVGDRPFRVHSSDLRIYVEDAGLATFPDGAVICGPLAQHPPSPKATATNPMILVEVTSDASETYDTGDKLAAYQTIASLREVVIVSHRERRIVVHSRGEGGAWTRHTAITGGRLAVPSLDATLVVDEVYRGATIG